MPTTTHEQNMQRNEEITACQDNIRILRQTLQKHKRAWKEHFVQTALRRIGAEAFFDLTTKEQKSKANLLILLEYDKLPYSLGGGFWNNSPLKDDRDLLLARLRRPHFVQELGAVVFVLPDSLKGDREVVTAAVRAYPMLLAQLENDDKVEWYWEDKTVLRALFEAEKFDRREDYLRRFSVTLRSDSNLMLEALRHGIRVFEVIPKKLRNSHEFALQAAAIMSSTKYNYGPKCLKSFSQRLKSDFMVVHAFCRCDGSSLACASYAARRNLDIVRTACQQEPTALIYCLKGSARTRLIQDKSFWIEMLRRAEPVCGCPFTILRDKLILDDRIKLWNRLWEILPPPFQQDPEIVLLMLQKAPPSSHERFSLSLLANKSFLVDVAALGRLYAIPAAEVIESGLVTLDLEFCCQIFSQELVSVDVAITLVNVFPDLYSHRRFWECVNPSQLEETLDFLFEDMPDDIANDKEIMLRFSTCERAVEHLAAKLWETSLLDDRDVIENLLSIHPEALLDIPDYVQELYPDLVAKCIENLLPDSYLMECLHDAIDESLWSNRDIAMAWIRKGGEDLFFLDEYFSDDEEVFLAVAEHNWDEFYMASVSLLTNKEFLIKAVSVNGQVWTMLEEEMKEQFDIALAAFSASPNLAYYCAGEDFSFLTTFARKVRNELQIHDSFVQLFVCSTDLPSSGNIFAMLNQGQHTTLQYKKVIAEYIGLPRGDYLCRLKSASENLALWGF